MLASSAVPRSSSAVTVVDDSRHDPGPPAVSLCFTRCKLMAAVRIWKTSEHTSSSTHTATIELIPRRALASLRRRTHWP
jgi:hypothetical protein